MKHIFLALAALSCAALPAQATCTSSSFGDECGGRLTATAVAHGGTQTRITFLMQGGPDQSASVLMFGLERVAFRIPGSDCSLLVLSLVGVPFNSGPPGNHHLDLTISNTLVGTVLVQAGTLTQSGRLTTTNGVRVACVEKQ